MINKKNFITRTISGFVLVVLLIALVLISKITALVVLSLIALMCNIEFLVNMKKIGIEVMLVFTSIYSVVLLFLSVMVSLNIIDNRFMLGLLLLYPFLRGSVEMFRNKKEPLKSLSYETFSLLYTFIPILFIFTLSHLDSFRSLVLALFILVWVNDIGAYLVGITIGKHKLFERLSPKKSWEGFYGGLITSMLIAFLINKLWLTSIGTPLTWILVGFAVSISGVLGDLFESMIKRSFNIKDSGNTIPGHGGFLDRFDAFLFASPIYVIMIYLLAKLN